MVLSIEEAMEASTTAEKDKLLELNSLANEEFDNGNYDKCLGTLNKCLETQMKLSSGTHCQLRHNLAVVEFYKSECKDFVRLLLSLHELDAEEISTSKTSTIVSPSTTCLNPIARYNKAVVYYHRRMHRTALDTLGPVIEKLDSLDDNTGTLVGTLVLRLLLATNQLSKAFAFLEVLTMHFGLNSEESTAEESALSQGSESAQGSNRTFKLLALLTNVLNHKVVVVPDDGSAEFTALKAHHYYILKDFQMAAKQLIKMKSHSILAPPFAHSPSDDELDTIIANNMGVIHLRVRHYAIAGNFFQRAISFDKKTASKLHNISLHRMSSAHSCEILYNLGISMLYLRRPREAFQCFVVPLKSYHSNPRLWVRLAESCIMEHEMKMLEEDRKFLASPSGTNPRRFYISKPTAKVNYATSTQSAAVPEPTLEFAALSLRNALSLTYYYRSTFSPPQSDGNESDASSWNTVKDNNFCSPSQPISKESCDKMLSAIYAAYSYVSLRLGDFVTALEMAQELLKVEQISDAHRLLSHMYAGEALIMMDRLAESRKHLEPSFVSSLNAFDFETKDWQVKSLDAAQNVVRYNLAVAMVLQSDVEMARSLLTTCTHPIVAAKTKALKKYLDAKGA